LASSSRWRSSAGLPGSCGSNTCAEAVIPARQVALHGIRQHSEPGPVLEVVRVRGTAGDEEAGQPRHLSRLALGVDARGGAPGGAERQRGEGPHEEGEGCGGAVHPRNLPLLLWLR
jgi:hypothetical protein